MRRLGEAMSVPRVVVLLAVALAMLSLPSCGRDSSQGAFSVRDSSGVRIVSNPSAVAGDSGCPSVDSVPALAVGGADAEGPYDVLRVAGALRLADGGVVVLNAATSELRLFDRSGRYTRTFGRAGTGPGEFRNPAGLRWYGVDTLMLSDCATARVTLLGSDGRLIAGIGLRGFLGGVLLGRLADGSFVFSTGAAYSPGAQPGRRRDPAKVVRVSREGTVLDTLGTFPGSEALVEGDAHRVMVTSAPFGHNTFFTMANGSVFAADNAEYRVRTYAEGRRLERIVERAFEPVPLTAAEVEREKAERTSRITDPRYREQLGQMYRSDRHPETLPVHGRVVVDADGWLWVRAYSDAPGGSIAWDVYDAAGRLRCSAPLPSALSVQEIGRDFLLGTLRDSDGVEQVQLYEVRRAGSPRRGAVGVLSHARAPRRLCSPLFCSQPRRTLPLGRPVMPPRAPAGSRSSAS